SEACPSAEGRLAGERFGLMLRRLVDLRTRGKVGRGQPGRGDYRGGAPAALERGGYASSGGGGVPAWRLGIGGGAAARGLPQPAVHLASPVPRGCSWRG